jgi:hypothetical protein
VGAEDVRGARGEERVRGEGWTREKGEGRREKGERRTENGKRTVLVIPAKAGIQFLASSACDPLFDRNA